MILFVDHLSRNRAEQKDDAYMCTWIVFDKESLQQLFSSANLGGVFQGREFTCTQPTILFH